MMENEVNKLLEDIKASYAEWSNRNGANAIRDEMIAKFNENISYTAGKKFIKVITDGSVWGFIVLSDQGKFRRGDILKAASWNAPAKNFARGNILDGDYKVFWAGAQ